MNFRNIYTGWKNHLFPDKLLKEHINAISDERMFTCSLCHRNSKYYYTFWRKLCHFRWDEHCLECGCTLSAKTKCLEEECPLGKWKAITKEEK